MCLRERVCVCDKETERKGIKDISHQRISVYKLHGKKKKCRRERERERERKKEGSSAFKQTKNF